MERLDIRVVYCGDSLESPANLPGARVDLIYIFIGCAAEIESFFQRSYKDIADLTVQEIPDEPMAKKLERGLSSLTKIFPTERAYLMFTERVFQVARKKGWGAKKKSGRPCRPAWFENRV